MNENGENKKELPVPRETCKSIRTIDSKTLVDHIEIVGSKVGIPTFGFKRKDQTLSQLITLKKMKCCKGINKKRACD